MSTTSSATDETLLRLPQVLARFPVSRSGWYQGVKAGKYPQPVRIGERAVAWKASDIRRLVQAASA
ncbi:helix-turn-helix transcriptional regulator [Pulveribacter suum]|uniref:Uncharacterized protein n=1 Tax=Pulveribacter suum TaxID=2116657 RepID=A0A2P1NJ75_9BURK|nr:AlpA family phage regulatory protein [Pulveribacter suum]AVP57105.1 hypothetical protein C7H73_05130 [Pulveribacter suum]